MVRNSESGQSAVPKLQLKRVSWGSQSNAGSPGGTPVKDDPSKPKSVAGRVHGNSAQAKRLAEAAAAVQEAAKRQKGPEGVA